MPFEKRASRTEVEEFLKSDLWHSIKTMLGEEASELLRAAGTIEIDDSDEGRAGLKLFHKRQSVARGILATVDIIEKAWPQKLKEEENNNG